jgi:hypothetical protein
MSIRTKFLFWILFGLLACTTARAQSSGGQIEKGDFRFDYDEHGVISLANPHDPFAAQIVPRGWRLGLTVHFRSGDGEWQNGNKIALTRMGNWGYPLRGELKVTRQPGVIEIIREVQK